MVYANAGLIKCFDCGDVGHKCYSCPHKQAAAGRRLRAGQSGRWLTALLMPLVGPAVEAMEVPVSSAMRLGWQCTQELHRLSEWFSNISGGPL